MHGPHHDAQKFTTTILPRSSFSENVPPPSSLPFSDGAYLPSNGLAATVAGPTGFLYQPKPGQPTWHYGFVDAPLFGVNTLLLPYAFFKIPPWEPVEWKGATVEPTYTAVPPLPPE